MARKKNDIEKEIKKNIQRLEELKSTLEASIEEEREIIEKTKQKIDRICNDAGLDCCVIINKDAMIAIIEALFSRPGDTYRIPYQLYIKEN